MGFGRRGVEIFHSFGCQSQKTFGRQMELTKVGFLDSFGALADDPTFGDYDVETYFDTPLFGSSITPYR
ncbi:MAG: hypothetical protein ACI9YT_001921 [Halobacteriales archaeon]|jgi:hypothetical protein